MSGVDSGLINPVRQLEIDKVPGKSSGFRTANRQFHLMDYELCPEMSDAWSDEAIGNPLALTTALWELVH